MKGKDNLSNYLHQFSERLNIEIDFFIEQINTNLDYISAYNRYVKKNELFIVENPDNQAEFFRFAYDQYHSYFPYLINSSLLITFDSYFDTNFYKLTKQTSLLILNDFDMPQANGTYIYKCSKYFKERMGILIPLDNKNWVSITNNNNIRNLIVHQNSITHYNSNLDSSTNNDSIKVIEKKRKENEVYKLIHNCSYISLDELTGKFYLTDNDLLLCHLEDIRKFLTLVIELIRDKKNL